MAELRNVNVQFVSLVNKAANKKQFCIIKADNGLDGFCPIIKADDEKQEITAVVYEPMEEDAHEDYMTAEEIEKAQRSHALNGFNSDVQHSFMKDNNLKLVESWIQKEDGTIGEQPIKKGTWLQTIKVDNAELWTKVKNKEFTGFSMGGTGEKVEKAEGVSKEVIGATTEEIEKVEKGFFQRWFNFFKENIKKEEVKKEEILDMDEKTLREIMQSEIQKALEVKTTETEEVVKTEENEMSEDEKISKAVKEVLKSMGIEEEKEKEPTFEEKVAKEIATQLEPMKETIEKMAKAKGYSHKEENITGKTTETIKKSDDEIFNGLFVNQGGK